MEFGREICCSLANVEQRETMLAAGGNVTLPVIKERSGANCSAHLFLRICVRTTTQPEPLRFSSRLQIMCTATVSARPVNLLTASAPFAPRGCIVRAWTAGELSPRLEGHSRCGDRAHEDTDTWSSRASRPARSSQNIKSASPNRSTDGWPRSSMDGAALIALNSDPQN